MTLSLQIHALDSENTWSDDFEYRLTPDLRNKPEHGFWTSTYTPDEDTVSDWMAWCTAENFRTWSKFLMIQPHTDARILHIDCKQTLAKLPHVKLYTWSDDYVLNYPQIAMFYDAVHLTKDMVYTLRFNNGPRLSTFSSWDCESTVWLRKAWDLVGELP